MIHKNHTISMRCDDGAENLVFTCYDFGNGDYDFEINVEDAYCGGDYTGLFGRLKRAWNAFCAKPVYYASVYTADEEKMHEFLTNCMELIERKGDAS